jgi:hypothetical protein
MSLDQKQISIEKATLEYDRNWFNMQGKEWIVLM